LKLSIPPKQDGIHHRESFRSQNASNIASSIMQSIMNYFPHVSLNMLNIEEILNKYANVTQDSEEVAEEDGKMD
jgi:hypothetical protein